MSANVEDKNTRITGGVILDDILTVSPFILIDLVSNYIFIKRVKINKLRQFVSV